MSPAQVQELATRVLAEARSRGLKIATAESCTGGMVSAALTDIAGSSDVFDRGFVTYSNEAKQAMLGVPAATIAAHGAVSSETATAMAKHGVKLMQLTCAPLERADANTRRFGNISKIAFLCWQKFMQRRIKQANGNRQARHHLKNRLEVSPLFRKQPRKRCPSARLIFSQNHLAHRRNPACLKKHMFSSAKSYTFCSKVPSNSSIFWCISVSSYF